MNQSFYVRQGVSFLQMSPEQRERAFGLLRASLSARGLKLTRDMVALYVDNMDDGHARVKMDEVRTCIDRTWLA